MITNTITLIMTSMIIKMIPMIMNAMITAMMTMVTSVVIMATMIKYTEANNNKNAMSQCDARNDCSNVGHPATPASVHNNPELWRAVGSVPLRAPPSQSSYRFFLTYSYLYFYVDNINRQKIIVVELI